MGGNKASKLVDKVEKMNLNGGGAGMEDQPDGCFPRLAQAWKMEDQCINVPFVSSKPAVPDQMECYQQQVRQFVKFRPR